MKHFFCWAIGKVMPLMLIALIMGCGQQSEYAVSIDGTDNNLQLFNWNNYISPETIKRFESFCNRKVSQDYYSDHEEMLAKLTAGATGYDLIVPTSNAMNTIVR